MPVTSKLYYLVGPSGVGKDTVLGHLKKIHYSGKQPLVAHRYITRPVVPNDENHIELAEFDFMRRLESGLFLFNWSSHGYQYAIGREVKRWLKRDNSVLVNGSRNYLEQAREIYPPLVPIWMNVSETVLRQRLKERGRESEEQIEKRIQRNREMETLKPNDCVTINNDQTIEDTIGQLLALVEISNI